MECLNIDFVGPFPDGGYVRSIDTFKMGGVNARKGPLLKKQPNTYSTFWEVRFQPQLQSDRGATL
jgi:hypothetical protein